MNIVWLAWKDRGHPTAGGAEVVAHELMSRLVAAGHTVTLITSGYSHPVTGQPAVAHDTDPAGYHIIRTGNRLSTYLMAARYFRKHRQQLAPDLVIDECNTLAYFARFYTGVRTIQLFHQLARQIWFYELPLPISLIGYVVEPLYLRLLSRSPEVITISESTRLDLIRYGYRPSAIKLISEGIQIKPVDRLDAHNKYDHPTILSHGAVRNMKRTLHQLQAFELAKRRLPDLRLIISGDYSGSYGRRLQSAVAASPYRQHIQLLGRTSQQRKIELMQRCHLIAVTSVKEGWGLIVSEAGSQGTPAVVYDVDGLRDAVDRGRAGYLTTANNPTALADVIIDVLSNPTDYTTMQEAAWEFASQLTFDRAYHDLCLHLGVREDMRS